MRNSSPVALGEVIAGKYQVESVIGEGGMGLVVSAWHLGLRQRVAIKLLLAGGGPIEEAALERFQREARAAARIRSEHVCRVLDVGTLPDGVPYLVLEYLEGCDLADELSRRSRLPPAEAIGYVLEACEALAEAHAAGIIHRDLKPANLFLARRPNGSRCLKLLDFGVSKSLAESSVESFSLTKTSSIIGSPIYMSPEQLNSAKDVDVRTDIWALGALTYELIAGRPPFFGETIPQLVSQVLHSEPARFAELGITAPGGLEAVLQRALMKPREMRYGSVGEFAQAIGPYSPPDSISVSHILRIRPNGGRDPLPETVSDGPPRNRTPISGRTPPAPLSGGGTTASDKSSWRWAWAALALIALAGVVAALSRQLGSQADARQPGAMTLGTTGDAGSESEGSLGSRAAQRRASTGTLPPSLPTLPVPSPAQAESEAESARPFEMAPVEQPQTAEPGSSELPRGRTPPRAKTRSDKPIVAPAGGRDELDVSNFGGRR
jgi:eukaryotic-like serine/threonine-protein kinase